MISIMPKSSIAKAVECMLNYGLLEAIPTGEFVQTHRGNWVLIAGMGPIQSVVGPGNMFKTDKTLYPMMVILKRYKCARLIIYDTENSLKYKRIYRIARACGLPPERITFTGDDPTITIVKANQMLGNHFVEHLRTARDLKIKNAKSLTRTMPVTGFDEELIQVLAPHQVAIDSLTALTSDAVEDISEKSEIDDSDQNMLFMRDGLIKTRFLTTMPNLSNHGGFYFSMTAQVGDLMQVGKYDPKPLVLKFSPNGKKAKGVPPKFQYHNDLLTEVVSGRPLTDDKRRPEWPASESDESKSNDLMEVKYVVTRNKNGPSGITIPLIFSQSESLQEGLTYLLYLREEGKGIGDYPTGYFGLIGNNTRFQCALMPEVTMMRTTARNIIKEQEILTNALYYCCELLQVRLNWRHYEDWWLTPSEIYERCVEQGYDMYKLLNTRNYWIFEEDREGELPELSTMDLCLIARGKMKPYFLESDGQTYKKGMFDEDGRLTAKGFKAGL